MPKTLLMSLIAIDWTIIVIYLLFTLCIGFIYRRFADKGIDNYFLGGRKLPWHLAGLSMVATTFAADTPLLVTELVSTSGISGNWLWWNMAIGGVLTTFFFAKLWRRSGILTEVEFLELRYSGKKAKFLRLFKASYLGIFLNVIIIGWVNVAFISILSIFFNLSQNHILLILLGTMLFATFYSTLSGLKGIVVADAFQFVLAMTGSIVLAFIVIRSDKIGGMSGLVNKLNIRGNGYMNFFPAISKTSDIGGMLSISIGSFLAYVGIQWWSSWYPGAEPGGGGYVAQRMMSTRSEKDSLWATLLFQVAHYAIRPWPWILVGLASIVLYPHLTPETSKEGYVMAINEFLPAGLKGLMFISLTAAYMSTISTQLNWGAAFIVNDIYKRLATKTTVKKEIMAGRLATVVLILLSIIPTLISDTITQLWQFLIACGAGLGLVLILRWYWWRINAWSEITATFVPLLLLPVSSHILKLEFPVSLFFLVGTTSIIWIAATLLTAPEDACTLGNFYNKVKPAGKWKIGTTWQKEHTLSPWLFLNWIAAVVFIYSFLFCVGKFIFLQPQKGFVWLISGLLSLGILIFSYKKSENAQ